jgi:DNA gyrase subunit A
LILGRQGILDYFTRGRGTLKVRAKAATEKFGKDRDAIIVTEIPYQVNKARLIESAAALVNEKKIEGISEIRDESDRDGMRIVFELKRGEQPEVILNNLYKHTQLQVNFGVIMLSIVNGQPRERGLMQTLKYFIDHRVEVVRRRTEFELRKARDREHLLLGFRKALEMLDAVIKLIRASKTPKEAREGLIAQFEFTEKQAQAIIEMQLQRLTGMEIQKILDELAEIQRRITEYLEILASDKKLRRLIVTNARVRRIWDEQASRRRRRGRNPPGRPGRREDVAVTVTRGYLKRTAVDTYRRRSRGGRAASGWALGGLPGPPDHRVHPQLSADLH